MPNNKGIGILKRLKKRKVIVIGLGNVLLGDEGVGVHAVDKLRRSFKFPAVVELINGGVSGVDILPHIERAENLIIIDAVQAQAKPGTIFRFTPEDIPPAIKEKNSLHQMGIQEVLAIASAIKKCPKTIIIGIQPKNISSYNTELTDEIEIKLPYILDMIIGELKSMGINDKLSRPAIAGLA